MQNLQNMLKNSSEFSAI